MIRTANDLPAMVDRAGPTDVALVPNTGVQFIDVPLPLGALRLTTEWYEEPAANGRALLRRLQVNEADGRLFYEQGGKRVYVRQEDERSYAFDLRGALLPFLGKWVPLPFLEVVTAGEPGRRKLALGPENWARLHLVELAQPDTGGQTHRAVLAFDTTTRPEGGAYLAPREGRSGDFVLASTQEEVAWLLDSNRDRAWVSGWLEELYRERDRNGQRLPPEERIGLQHLAAYLTLLEALEASGALSRVRMLRLSDGPDQGYVDVDLVLDLGNSRSCGFLIEQVPGQPRSVSSAYRLQLRDLSQPQQSFDLPFQSRVEFARPQFGKERWSEESGREAAFDWPCPVRVGPEAVRLSSLNRGNEGQTGLSSPKRYLWDDRKRLSPWRYNTATDPSGLLIGGFLEHLGEDGSVNSATGAGDIAMSALFSRASIFTLFLLEVLLQARAQMNSFAAREGRVEKLVPRRLANLVLTLPPAMPVEEVKAARSRAEAAIHLLRDATGGMGARPTSLQAAAEALREVRLDVGVEAKLDEATATQIVYLYDQIAQVHRGDAPLYLSIAGRARPAPDGAVRPSLRIASIDVGGGTTDLAIHTYRLDHNVLVPTEEFREGFRLAGDDVLENVVMRHVMPGLARALSEAGLGAERARAFVLGTFRGPLPTEPESQHRRLVVNHLLAPAAVALLSDYEAWDTLTPAGTSRRSFGTLLAPVHGGLQAKLPRDEARPPRETGAGRAAAWIEERARFAGASDFRFEAVELDVDVAAIHETVRQTLREAIEPLNEIVAALGCDLVLLSGRGSRWPAVQELVTAAMAVPPHRVHPMHRHRAGAWYPFPDATGRISDPKTTVAVGAMLQRLLRGGQLDNLAMREKFGTRSTARYIGKVETNGRIRASEVCFGQVDLDQEAAEAAEATITFPGNCFIGFRQFAAERWPATRLYRLAFGAGVPTQGIAMPITVRLRREQKADAATGAEAPLKFRIVEGSVVDREGKQLRRGTIVLGLQTLPGDEGSHWLDSGQLETLDAMLAATGMGG